MEVNHKKYEFKDVRKKTNLWQNTFKLLDMKSPHPHQARWRVCVLHLSLFLTHSLTPPGSHSGWLKTRKRQASRQKRSPRLSLPTCFLLLFHLWNYFHSNSSANFIFLSLQAETLQLGVRIKNDWCVHLTLQFKGELPLNGTAVSASVY